ncbi:K-like domain protein [Artemisia annua]|uniref:K-like domain protein n=1 Tax=Artemisia annua TaxID=35608 RepID=A0A2U1M6Z3_ARTAN|nr:K-like domain protein [Artemisia annua]
MAMDWQGAPASPSSYTVMRILRFEIPIDSFPNVSFQEDANTSLFEGFFSHNYIQGKGSTKDTREKGSIKDPDKAMDAIELWHSLLSDVSLQACR